MSEHFDPLPIVDLSVGDRVPMSEVQLANWLANGAKETAVFITEGPNTYGICTPETVWAGHEPRQHLRVREVVEMRPLDQIRELAEAGKRAAQARRRSLKKCTFCGKLTAPERGDGPRDEFACHGCMERHLGVVF